ncbi:MAG: stage II sporulation protein M [Candidatus Azobacteroides sp.]|nr:stage II sporulation protein M [Candidatus Azobacteroides sp.]
MREVVFIKKNEERWKKLEKDIPNQTPDELAESFIELSDDVAYARTFYPGSDTERYLNALLSRFHQVIYKNKKEKKGRFLTFWKYEVPLTVRSHHKELFYSFLFFAVFALIGAFSAAKDDTFVRLILGDRYVNQTIQNIETGDPMAIYKSGGSTSSFLMITTNNIAVSFMVFIYGLFFSIGTVYILMTNGIMLGSFQYFFYEKNVFLDSITSIWLHGTLEISAIVIAGGAGLVMGNSLLFPKTYSRKNSFMKGAKDGLKILVGLIPVFIIAGFLEGFITRYTKMPLPVSATIILSSLAFVIFYFIIYPIRLEKKIKKYEQKN